MDKDPREYCQPGMNISYSMPLPTTTATATDTDQRKPRLNKSERKDTAPSGLFWIGACSVRLEKVQGEWGNVHSTDIRSTGTAWNNNNTNNKDILHLNGLLSSGSVHPLVYLCEESYLFVALSNSIAICAAAAALMYVGSSWNSHMVGFKLGAIQN